MMKNILTIKQEDPIMIGLDIGGTLTKLAVILKKDSISNTQRNQILMDFDFLEEIEIENNYLYIKKFLTSKFNTDTVGFIRNLNKILPLKKIYATGGGAYKFFDLINEEFNIKMEKLDELLSLVKGYSLMSNYNTFYEFHQESQQNNNLPVEEIEYPHLAVNVGSGVSILIVNSLTEVKRATGTLMGGGTLIGLSKLLIQVDNYNDIMKLAQNGDNTNVDLLVKDIYQNKLSSKKENSTQRCRKLSDIIQPESEIIASSFGKINQLIQLGEKEKIKKEDIAKSLLLMICYHIAQLAYLVCKKNNIKK